MLVELAGTMGLQATEARDGAAAVVAVVQADEHHEPFDLLLLDWKMPVMDGDAATQALRQQPQWSDLPVIAMTANAMAGDREKALEAGMNDHIAKPIDVDEMFATLARHVRRHAAAEGDAPPQQLTDPARTLCGGGHRPATVIVVAPRRTSMRISPVCALASGSRRGTNALSVDHGCEVARQALWFHQSLFRIECEVEDLSASRIDELLLHRWQTAPRLP